MEAQMPAYIEIAMMVLMVGSLAGAMVNRYQLKKGIGGRIIQFVGLFLAQLPQFAANISRIAAGASCKSLRF
jgi:hypothetical protein